MLTLALGSCGSPSDPVDTAGDTSAPGGARCDALDELAILQGDAEALQTIVAQVDDPDPRIVRCATSALRHFKGGSQTADLMNPLLTNPNPVVVAAAATALGDPLEPHGDTRSVVLLERVATKGSGHGADAQWAKARRAAVLALAVLGDRHADQIMLRMLRNEPGNADAAASALVRLFADDIGRLLPLLDDRRNGALVYPLVRLKSPRADEALVTVLNRSSNPRLAEYYLNHGDRRLRHAANRWADAHGYWIGTGPATLR